MTTTLTPQDEIAAIHATLALHAQDLARINRQLPELAETVRLGLERQAAESAAAHERIFRELQAIRERQDAQESAIARIDGEIAHIKEQLDILFARTDAIIAQMATMSSTLKSLDSRVGNLTGTRLERRVARTIRGRLRRAIGLTQCRILHRDWGETDDDLVDLLDDADERGAITRQEREDVLDADLIVAGAAADGQRAYAVIEIGVTVDNLDVNRAARRARTVAKATDAECTAIVAGSAIPDAERARAARAGAAVITVSRPED